MYEKLMKIIEKLKKPEMPEGLKPEQLANYFQKVKKSLEDNGFTKDKDDFYEKGLVAHSFMDIGPAILTIHTKTGHPVIKAVQLAKKSGSTTVTLILAHRVQVNVGLLKTALRSRGYEINDRLWKGRFQITHQGRPIAIIENNVAGIGFEAPHTSKIDVDFQRHFKTIVEILAPSNGRLIEAGKTALTKGGKKRVK